MALLRSLLPVLALRRGLRALALLVENSYYQLMMTLVLVWACFGLSWNLFSGYTGLVSFGHAAFFGTWRLHDRARPDPPRPLALAPDPGRSARSAASPAC